MNKKYALLAVLCMMLVGVMSGCKKKKLLSSAVSPELLEENWWVSTESMQLRTPPELAYSDLEAATFKSKLSMNSAIGSFEEVSVTLRLKPDSLIWLSASHLGFEVVRALIAPDSIRILNRFQKQYITADYTALSRKMGIELSYPQVQSLLTGDLSFPPTAAQWFVPNDSLWIYQQKDFATHMQGIVYSNSHKLKESYLKSLRNGDVLLISHQDYQKSSQTLYPTATLLELTSLQSPARQMKLTLQHQKIEPLGSAASYPFSIPTNYKRIRL